MLNVAPACMTETKILEDSAHQDHQDGAGADHARQDPHSRREEVPFQVRDRLTRNTGNHLQPAQDGPPVENPQYVAEIQDAEVTTAYRCQPSATSTPCHQNPKARAKEILRDVFSQPDNDLPDHWDTTDTLYDQNQYGGLPLPKIVPATASARKNGTSGMDPLDIKVWQVAFEGKHNYMLRQLANGRWTLFQGHKSLPMAKPAPTVPAWPPAPNPAPCAASIPQASPTSTTRFPAPTIEPQHSPARNTHRGGARQHTRGGNCTPSYQPSPVSEAPTPTPNPARRCRARASE